MEEFITSLTIYDYIAMGIIGLSILFGVSRGFIVILGKVISLVVSFLGAKLLSLGITEFIYDLLGGRTALYEKTLMIVENQVNQGKINLESAINVAIDNSVIPLESFKTKLMNDTAFRLHLENSSINPVEDIAMKVVETIEPSIIYVLSIVLFIILFILLRIITTNLTRTINKVIKGTKVTGGLNSILGGALGLIRGVSIVVIIYYMLLLYVTVIGDLPGVEKEIFMNSRIFTMVTQLSTLI